MSEIGKSVTVIIEGKLTNLVHFARQMIQDIDNMRDPKDPNWFGQFPIYDDYNDGVVIEWPNLHISCENLKKALHDWEAL